MPQEGRENQQRTVLHSHDDLVGVLGRELDDGWPEDPGLIPRVMEVDGVRTRMSPQVVDTAQKIVGVVVGFVLSPWSQDRRPAGCYLELVVADSQELQNPRHSPVHAGDEILEVVEHMQRLNRLPTLAGRDRWQISSHTRQSCEGLRVDRFAQLRCKLDFPHERGEHRNDIRRVVPPTALPGHEPSQSNRPVETAQMSAASMCLSIRFPRQWHVAAHRAASPHVSVICGRT